MRRAMFGRRSERIDDDQLALALEALETEPKRRLVAAFRTYSPEP
jgi:Transposase C of IS166 homeodomain